MNSMTLNEIYKGFMKTRENLVQKKLSPMEYLRLNFEYPTFLLQQNPEARNEIFKDIKVIDVNIENLTGQWFIHKDSKNDRRILYLHGGAFLYGSTKEYEHVCALLSKFGECSVLAINYRLAPKYPFPGALEDAYKGYIWMHNHGPQENSIIKESFICGDSAGANLALGLTYKLKALNDPISDGILLMSVSADETRSSSSWLYNKEKDLLLGPYSDMLTKDKGKNSAYLNGHNPRDYYVSPLFGDFTGFPPLFIQVSKTECLYGDSIEVHNKARKSGVKSILNDWDNLPHVWQLYAPFLKESVEALRFAGEFIKNTV